MLSYKKFKKKRKKSLFMSNNINELTPIFIRDFNNKNLFFSIQGTIIKKVSRIIETK